MTTIHDRAGLHETMALQKLLDTKFEWIDRTNDGFLSRADVEEMAILQGLPISVVKEFMEFCDTDKDGKISKGEFNDARKRRQSRKLSATEVELAFSKFHPDSKGKVHYDQFKKGLKEQNKGMKDSKIRKLFKKYDKDNDGCLNITEFTVLAEEMS